MYDSFGRKIDYLRLSVTDRCDLRCKYCMPENTVFSKKKEQLTLNNLTLLSDIFVKLGIKKIRITGGEPLVRKDIFGFTKHLKKYLISNKLTEVALSTNGTLLEAYAEDLFENGIKRLNVSLDSLIPSKYSFITNGGKIDNVIKGIEKAKDIGFEIKINTVLIKNFNIDEILNLCSWSSKNNFKISFIETMPVGKVETTRFNQYYPTSEAKNIIKQEFGLEKIKLKTNGPSRYFKCKRLNLIVGFISPISNNFCEACNRIRLTSNGILYGCLGQDDSIDLKSFLINEDYVQMTNIIKKLIYEKPEKHLFNINDSSPAVSRNMNFTGG